MLSNITGVSLTINYKHLDVKKRIQYSLDKADDKWATINKLEGVPIAILSQSCILSCLFHIIVETFIACVSSVFPLWCVKHRNTLLSQTVWNKTWRKNNQCLQTNNNKDSNCSFTSLLPGLLPNRVFSLWPRPQTLADFTLWFWVAGELLAATPQLASGIILFCDYVPSIMVLWAKS